MPKSTTDKKAQKKPKHKKKPGAKVLYGYDGNGKPMYGRAI